MNARWFIDLQGFAEILQANASVFNMDAVFCCQICLSVGLGRQPCETVVPTNMPVLLTSLFVPWKFLFEVHLEIF